MTANANGYSLQIFAGKTSTALAEKVCAHLKIELGQARTTVFPDGELIVKLEEDVRGRDCFVIFDNCRSRLSQ